MIHGLKTIGNTCSVVVLLLAAAFGLNGCSDVSKAPAPAPAPAGPGALTILTTSPLPDGTMNHSYSIALAASGGTPGYTWSLAPGSPQLPPGLTLSTGGIISGTPTTVVGPVNLVIQVQDSGSAAQGSQQTVTKTLSMTVNVAPTPLQITSTSPLTAGTINVPYFAALTGNGGTTPYTWAVKAGSSLPPGLTLGTANGFIQGTPTQTSNLTPSFTLTDAAGTTVEKALNITISAVPLSITTTSPLPQATAGQNYSTTLVATGGTGTHTWGLAIGSPLLTAVGLTLNASTGVISGIPTGTSNQNYTFTATDQTLPNPQVATKVLQLVIGAAPPTLIITTNSPLSPGTVTQSYNFTLIASGGTGADTWDLSSGSLPVGLNLSSSGVISGTPVSTGTSSPTFRVRDSGNPQQTATKQLSITIGLPAAPTIQTTSLPNGSFNQSYNQTLQVTGGIAPLIWGVILGALPNGLGLNASTGLISGTATQTGTFNFTVQVTDVIPQSDTQALSIIITAPPPPTITTSSLPIGTVNQSYPVTTLQASGGTAPLTWDPVVNPALPNGLSWDAATHTISGMPLAGSEGTASHTFTVRDSTNPIQTVQKGLSLMINAALTVNENSLPNGTVGTAYNTTLTASGGASPYTWSITGPGAPNQAAPGLTLSSGGVISGTPSTAVGSPFTRTYRVQDNNGAFVTKSLPLTVNAALTIDTPSPLPPGKVGDDYGTVTPGAPVILSASGGTPPYTWSAVVTPALPAGLTFDATTATISGIPTASELATLHTFTVQDNSVNPPAIKALSLTIAP